MKNEGKTKAKHYMNIMILAQKMHSNDYPIKK